MKRFVMWLCGLALAALGNGAAHAEWLEASSAHFRVFSDTSEASITAFAAKLERYDAALRLLFPSLDDTRGKSNPLVIYVVPDVSAVQKLYGRKRSNIAGFYLPRAGGSIAYTPRRAGSGSQFDLDAETVLFHEYAHHFMYQNFAAAYPAWFTEGFAEFNGTANVLADGTTEMGRAALHRAYGLLQMGSAMPIERLLAGNMGKMNLAQGDAFYGRGWLLTHYLTFDTARTGQLDTYLKAINAGVPSLKAATDSFGDLHKLDRDLDGYLHHRRILSYRIPADKIPIGPVKARVLSAGEAAMMSVRERSDRGVDKAGAQLVVADARRLAAPFPNDPAVQAELAEAEYDAGDIDAADAAADRAIAADPKNFDGLLYKGRIAVHRALADKAATPETWKAARRWFIKANAIESDNAEPLALFYTSFVAAGVEPTQNATDALMKAFDLAPEDPGVRWQVAGLLLRKKDLKAARNVLGPIAFDPHGNGDANPAALIIARIDAGDDADTVRKTAETSDPPGDDDGG